MTDLSIRPLDRPDSGLERLAKANGFSLHAGVSCEGRQGDKRERLCELKMELSKAQLAMAQFRATPASSSTLRVVQEALDTMEHAYHELAGDLGVEIETEMES